MKKYILLENETIEHEGKTLYRIQAVKRIKNKYGSIKIGSKGGYIESEDNLSHDGPCWVDSEAKVHGNAKVYGNAFVCDNTEVGGNAKVYGRAFVYD